MQKHNPDSPLLIGDIQPDDVHHYSAEQKSYEEDILPTWTDVVGHYRWILTE